MGRVFYELSPASLSHIVSWLVRANGQLPWLRDWVNAQLETREESRRQAREHDTQRRALKRELADIESQVKALQTQSNLDKDEAASRDLKSAELRAKKMASRIAEIDTLIEECDTRAFEGVRLEALGVDRWSRRYWQLADKLWVEIDPERSEFCVQLEQQPSTPVKEEQGGVASPKVTSLMSSSPGAIHTTMTPTEGDHSVKVASQESERATRPSLTRWYQYTRPEHIEALKSYLCPLGIHEGELLVALQELPPTLQPTHSHSPGTKETDTFDDEMESNASDTAGLPLHARKRRRVPVVEIGIRKGYVNKLR